MDPNQPRTPAGTPPQDLQTRPRAGQDFTVPARPVSVPSRSAAASYHSPTPAPAATPQPPVATAPEPAPSPIPIAAPAPPTVKPISEQAPAPAPTPTPLPPSPVQSAITLSQSVSQNPSAVTPPTASKKTSIWSKLRPIGTFTVFIGFVWGGAVLLNAFVFQSYYVDGLSMTPTLHDNDRLIVSKVENTGSAIVGKQYVPNRGQIVVIDSRVSEFTHTRNEEIIKRVIGLPGETISIAGGTVTVFNSQNPQGFDVNQALGLKLDSTYSEQPQLVKIPDDSVFVMGDNRAQGGSYDSREFGPVKTDLLKGRLWARILPLNDMDVF